MNVHSSTLHSFKKMRRVPLHEITKVLEESEGSDNLPITVTPDTIDLSELDLNISTDLVLTFDKTHEISCKSIKILDATVTIHDLALKGTISIINSVVTIHNCIIHDPNSSADYLLSAEKSSTVFIYDSLFEECQRFGICGDDGSSIRAENCIFSKIRYNAAIFTSHSSFTANYCQFNQISSDVVYLDYESTATLNSSTIENSEKRAISINLNSSLCLSSCIIRNCEHGAVFSTYCDRVLIDSCTINDCRHTAMYFEHSAAAIKNCTISSCNGNGINAAHQTKMMISGCDVKKTVYPPIAICDNSFGYIKCCRVSDSKMSGIIIRNRSTAIIETSTIENSAQHGICISDSLNINIQKCLLIGNAESAISCYNQSIVQIKTSYILGPSRFGIDIFTGARVTCCDLTCIGMKESCVWLHHGGSGKFYTLLMATKPIESRQDVVTALSSLNIEECREEVPLEKLFKIETKRPVFCKNSFATGNENFELALNLDVSYAPSGLEATHPKCKICGKDSSSCCYSTCGHSLYCLECWKALEQKPDKCELCLMQIDKISVPIDCSNGEDVGVCSICYFNNVDTLIVPCGHTICYECSSHWFQTNSECPFCREKVCRAINCVSYE